MSSIGNLFKSIFGFKKKAPLPKHDPCDLEGWEIPYINDFRKGAQDPQTSFLIDHVVNKHNFSFSFKLAPDGSKNLDLCFMENNILKFSASNPSKPSKFSMDYLVPLDITQDNSPELDFDDQPDFIEISSKDNAGFRIHINKKPFFIDVLSHDRTRKFIGLNHKNILSSSPHPALDIDFEHEFLYGIPERAENFLLPDSSKSQTPYRLYNLDRFGYENHNKSGLYGSIPLLIAPFPEKIAAIFWRNASNTWIDIQKNQKSSCLWLSETGDLEFYVITAVNLQELFFKLGKLLGFASLPPYFSLGYHHSKWSFNDQKDIEEIDQNFDLHKIPYDVIYLDIDYTDQMQYFTFNPVTFPDPLLMTDKLNEKGRNLVTIIDPHIKRSEGYWLYDEALEKGFFVRKDKSAPFMGSCWPGFSHWLDYCNSDVEKYWSSLFAYNKYVYSRPNTHIWNDMNEPAVFGTPDASMPKTNLHRVKTPSNEEIEVEHREVHNLYGFCQVRGTYKGLVQRNSDQNQRPFVLTRSFYAGIQKYAAVWTGDTLCQWFHLRITPPMLLSLSISGVSFCGGDIGGFYMDPTDELQIRWFQSAVIYPFFRGHSTKNAKRREPWLYADSVKEAIRQAILLRYEIIPYLYTLFFEYVTTNVPILRPLWYLMPQDLNLYGIDDKMMLGDAILSCPILDEKQKT